MSRINRCVELLDQGQPVYYDRVNVPDLSYEHGLAMSGTWADFLRIEFEHISLDTRALYDFMRGLRDAGPTPSGHSMPTVMCTLPGHRPVRRGGSLQRLADPPSPQRRGARALPLPRL